MSEKVKKDKITNGKGDLPLIGREATSSAVTLGRMEKMGADIGQLVVRRLRHTMMIASLFSIKYKARPSAYSEDKKEL